ncbi:MAG TPA: threonine ammonia-lyase, biosynthetic [Candidatus Saccharimonadales bacterium]|nr:threonine ammonia-lyase, biosynthetic [Candidatus Saccharimonadales bacterium]
MNEAVKQTLLARVYEVAAKTPLERATKLSQRLGFSVYLKREDTQPVHSFKLRGAYNKIASLSAAERGRGVIAASAGNHAQGVALAAQKLGLSALIVMPRTTPSIKVEAVKSYKAEVELFGDSYSDAAEHCKRRQQETGRVFIHPFDDPLIIAGQGTVGMEILEQLTSVSHIFVPVGGGGLIAGIAQYVKALRPEVKIISVEPSDSNALQTSIKAGRRVVLPHVGIFADGVAVKQLGEHTFPICRQFVNDSITVTTDEICAAVKQIFEETRSVVEGAGALGVAGITAYAASHDMSGSHAVAICSGANISFERLQFIAERTLLGSGKEALFAVTLSEKPGQLRRFCRQVVTDHNITQFGYRLQSRNSAQVLVGIGVADQADKQHFEDKMSKYDYSYTDFSGDDIAKAHTRHMIGGPSPLANNERLYQISFPERPGALADFLQAVDGNWNISLFHYRGQGGDEGDVLIGFEAAGPKELEKHLGDAGYEFSPVAPTTATIFLGY